MQRTASVDWTGSLKAGQGKISGGSGALHDLSYSYATRFGDQVGTNPEELIASAHAGCFTMALAAELEKMGLKPESLHADATTTLGPQGSKWSVTEIHLNVSGSVPGSSAEQFEGAAKFAKENCPVSRLLKAKITMTAKLLETKDEAA